MEPLKIFYSYAHEDRTLRGELGKHLANCRKQKICEDWSDGDIVSGDNWDQEIKDKLRSADVVLLLVSADFLNSDYIGSVEIQEAMQRHQEKKAQVIPVVLRFCDFEGSVFSKLSGLPTDLKPVTAWPNQDEAWTDVVRGLKRVFTRMRSTNGSGPQTSSAPSSAAAGNPPASAEPAAASISINEEQEANRALAATSTEAFQGLSELMANPKIRTFVAEEEDELIAADKALQVLIDYKNVHDGLHDLQFKCYNYIYQEGRKVEDNIDWPLLDQPQKDFAVLLDGLTSAANQPSLSEEDFAWLNPLRQANELLIRACNDLSIAPLQEAGRIIRNILELRPTVFDTKLVAAARTLPLNDLLTAVCVVRGKMSAKLLQSDAGKRFSAGVDALPQLSGNLQALTDEHTRWQVIATTFWSIDLPTDNNFDCLRQIWPKLRGRLDKICGGIQARWASEILESANKLDVLLATPAQTEAKELLRWKTRVRQTYTSCSNDSSTRFYQVDLSLKRLCDELRELQMALAHVLAELP